VPQPPSSLPPRVLFRFGAGFYLLVAIGGLVWIGARHGKIPLRLFVDPERWPLDLGLGVVLGLLLLAAWQGLRRRLAVARELEGHLASLVGSLSRSEAAGLSLLSGLAEELLFRGAIQPAWGFWPATLLFALLHTGRERALWLWTASAFVAGAVLGLAFAWTANLTAPVAAHTVVNAVQLSRLAGKHRAPVDW
jgi:hypothetical protein